MANTSTKKKFNDVTAPIVGNVSPQRSAGNPNQGAEYKGQMKGNAQVDTFADPMNQGVNAKIHGLDGLYDDIGERSGFITDGYLDKQGTHFGEAAKFNYLPPGMDIGNQVNAEINEMPLRKLTAESYPGDGWSPAPRDIHE